MARVTQSLETTVKLDTRRRLHRPQVGQRIEQSPYLSLFIALLLTFVFVPFLRAGFETRAGLATAMIAVVATGLRALAHRSRIVKLALVPAVALVVAELVMLGHHGQVVELVADAAGALVGATFMTGILIDIMTSPVVTADTVLGACVVYFLLGFWWARIFLLVYTVDPGAYTISGAALGLSSYDARASLIYFSYVTLATLGYGDVLPVSPPARALATLEAMLGQLYLAIMIARLVGLHAASRAAAGLDDHEPEPTRSSSHDD